jgi:DNA helicase-2/ATP-dependent DNA helicase PcrA
MTIHIAKGLEWPTVFITGMEDGLFPSLREREGVNEDAAMEEERRLAYVAITRARERLVMTHARTRRVWGEIRMQGPSRFLDELPARVLAGPARPRVITPRAPAITDGTWNASAGRYSGGRKIRRGGADEFDQRAPDDDEPVFRVDEDIEQPNVFRTGDQVSHTLLGVGRVVAMSDGKVIVEFAGAGRKTILPKFLARAGDDLN